MSTIVANTANIEYPITCGGSTAPMTDSMLEYIKSIPYCNIEPLTISSMSENNLMQLLLRLLEDSRNENVKLNVELTAAKKELKRIRQELQDRLSANIDLIKVLSAKAQKTEITKEKAEEKNWIDALHSPYRSPI